MKAKKRFLLFGLGAMTVLALGVGATSTFAWYKAEQTVTAALGDTATKLTAAKETADGEEVKLNFKLASTTNPELTDREDGEAYYLVDTVDGPKKVKNSSAIKIGQYAIEVEWQTGDQLKWAHAAKTGSISIDVKAVAQEANKIRMAIGDTIVWEPFQKCNGINYKR